MGEGGGGPGAAAGGAGVVLLGQRTSACRGEESGEEKE